MCNDRFDNFNSERDIPSDAAAPQRVSLLSRSETGPAQF
jgi:hypothetical protein